MQGKFDVFPGNQNEQTTLKPLEKKIIKDFNCSEFIFCSDAGLESANNRAFNSIGNRAYVITHSLKKMKQEYRDIALNPTQFRKVGSTDFIDIRTLNETDDEVFNSIYYKEVPVVAGDLDETLIVPSYTRTEITDSLHKTFGFRTDYEFIKKSMMRSIIKQTKEINLP